MQTLLDVLAILIIVAVVCMVIGGTIYSTIQAMGLVPFLLR